MISGSVIRTVVRSGGHPRFAAASSNVTLVCWNPAAAERLGYALIEDALSLANLPRRGGAVRSRPGYRRLVHRPWFLIFYRIDEARQVVEIARIWDARQDPALFTLS